MNRIIKIIVFATLMLTLTALTVYGSQDYEEEYVISSERGEYLLSVYKDGESFPITRSEDFGEINALIGQLREYSKLVFVGVTVNESFELNSNKYTLSGNISLTGNAELSVSGALNIKDASITVCNSAIRIKDGDVLLTNSSIISSASSSVVLDYSSGAKLELQSGSIRSSALDGAIRVERGTLIVSGGSVVNDMGAAIVSGSTVILSGNPYIEGKEQGIFTDTPITLSYNKNDFSGAVSVKYLDSFEKGSISCVFYSASEKSLENVDFFDKNSIEYPISFFDSFKGVGENNFGAVYLPFKAEFYNGEILVAVEEVVLGGLITAKDAPGNNGYEFAGWSDTENPDEFYDFARPVTKDISLYARYRLLPPSFSFFSMEFVYDGYERDFGVENISHPLIESAVINYTWYKDGVLISDLGPTLKVSRVDQSGEYRCAVSFTYGTDTAVINTPSVNLRIKKAAVQVPEPTGKYYSGEYQSPDIYSTSFYTVSQTGGIAVGVYPVKLTLTDFENCEFEGGKDVAYTDFYILKSDNFWTEEPTVFDIYEGGAPTPRASARFGSVNYLYSDSEEGTYTDAIPTAAGEYYVIAAVIGCENYGALRSMPVKFKIIAEKITGISIKNLPRRCEYKAFDSFKSEGLELYVTYNSSRVEAVGADKISFKYQSADTFQYGDNAVIATYMDVSVPIPVTVKKAEYDISHIVFVNTSVVYDGKKKRIDYSGVLPLGLDGIALSAEVSGGGVDAGEYTVTLSFSTLSKNYTVPDSVSATLTVLPYESEVIFSEREFVYDGMQKCPGAYYTDILGRKVNLSVDGGRSLAGEYLASVSGTDKNYKLLGTSVSYVIKKADYDFSSVIWSEGEFVYDGTERAVTVSGLPKGISVIGYSDNKAVSAGKYTAKAAILYDEQNYNEPLPLVFDWSIAKANYDTSCFSFSSAEYVYDGNEKFPVFSGEMPMGMDGSALEYRFLGSALHVSQGRCEVIIEFSTSSKNYNIPQSITAFVEIKPMGISVDWTQLEFVYDMKEHAPTARAEECEVGVLGAKTDAGSYTATAVSMNSDYFIVNPTRKFVIHKAENFWISALKIQDSFEGREPSPEARCLGGEVYYLYYDYSGRLLDGAPTLPGKYYVRALSDGDKNYNSICSDSLAFSVIEIQPISMSVEMNKEVFVSFEKITSSDCRITLLNNDGSITVIDVGNTSVEYQSNDGFRYGDIKAIISYLDFKSEISVTVNKADYDLGSVVWHGCEQIYDGSEKTAELLGLPSGVSVKSYIGGRGTSAGKYPVSAVLEYDRENYNEPCVEDGVLVIKKQTVHVPDISATIYNGKEQKPYISDTDLYSVTVKSGKNVGLYPIIVTLADKENYEFSDETYISTLYFEIKPREITVLLSDVEKYKFSAMPTPKYTITSGEVIDGDELDIVFEYGEREVGCRSLNENYKLNVIKGAVTRHDSLSENTVFLIFLAFFLFLTLLLIILIIIIKRKDIAHYISVLKCRFSSEENNGANSSVKKISPVCEFEKKEENENGINEVLSVDAERADSLITDSLAKDLVRKDDTKIQTFGNKKEIINVDTLSESFASGERVDINLLKKKSLIPYDTAYIKVLARGVIDKPLKVYANDFSLAAVKMIALTGGESVRVVTVKRRDAKIEKQNLNKDLENRED